MAVSDLGIDKMRESNVVATILPGTTLFLGLKTFAPARKMIEKGLTVALATDYNPGTSTFQSMPMIMNFSMVYSKMTIDEVFTGATRNSALALGRKDIGIIEEGS